MHLRTPILLTLFGLLSQGCAENDRRRCEEEHDQVRSEHSQTGDSRSEHPESRQSQTKNSRTAKSKSKETPPEATPIAVDAHYEKDSAALLKRIRNARQKMNATEKK